MSGAVRVEDAAPRTEPGVSYAIARLHQRLFAGITERVAASGLTTLQFTTLSVLSRHGAPLSTSQLARRAFMTPQSMSEVESGAPCRLSTLSVVNWSVVSPDAATRSVMPANRR